MNLLSPAVIKDLLSTSGTKPNKTLGQNFLIDQNVLHKIIAAANLTKESVVVEVGPGIGTLTRELSVHAKKVIAIEKDRKMVEILATTLADCQNVEIIQGDILEIPNSQFPIPNENYKVVANIPYYITSPLIRLFLESEKPPQEMVLMVQKEVAQRICAKLPNMSLLAISVQYYAEPKIISHVSKGCFWPSPKVDSAIIKITPLESRGRPTSTAFFNVVKGGFSQPRKQLLNNFSTALKKERSEIASWLEKNGIKPNQRAETLSLKDWENLANTCG